MVRLIVPTNNFKLQDIAMNELIANLIHSSQGYFHETCGVIIAFFDNPQQALRCANEITATVGKQVEVCGSRLSIS